MFCRNCGEQLKPNQNFCHNCGSEITITFKAPQSTPEYTAVPVSLQQPIITNEIGPYSIVCLIFGIISFGIVYLNLMTMSMRFPFVIFSFTMMMIIIISHFVGLICGIVSKVNSKLAESSGSINKLQKAGNTLGVLGIVFNAILLGLALFLFPVFLFA